MSYLEKDIKVLTENISKTSNSFLRKAKIKYSLHQEDEKLKKIYVDIGKKVHEIYAYGGSLGKYFDQKYLEIQKLELNINELDSQFENNKDIIICKVCKNKNPLISDYCGKCGSRLKGLNTKDDLPNKEIKKVQESLNKSSLYAEVLCKYCGSSNRTDNKFCLQCGRSLI